MITIYRVENHKARGFYHDEFYSNFLPVQYWYPVLSRASSDVHSMFIDNYSPTNRATAC